MGAAENLHVSGRIFFGDGFEINASDRALLRLMADFLEDTRSVIGTDEVIECVSPLLNQCVQAVIAQHGEETVIGIQDVMGVRTINKNAPRHGIQHAVLDRMV